MNAGIRLPRVLVCALAAATALPAVAHAQQGRYKRKSIAIKVEQTEKTKGIEAKPQNKEDVKPEITADEFMQIETKVQNIRDEQIQEYVELIKDTDADDPEKPDLLFRLAELYAQKQRYWRFRGMEAYGLIEKEKADPKKKELQRKQANYFNEEKKWLVQAIKVYKAIAEEPRYKNYARMDEALFFYAYTLQNAKYTDEARKVYHRLIKDYPNSKYIPSAYLSFADYYFAQNELPNAEKFYDKVLEFPKSSVYTYALYMKGWVYLNQARPQDALETFFKVAQLTEKDKKREVLNRAAKKDFVRAYAEVGKPQLAFKAFERVDKNYALTMLEILGELYLDQGKAEKTVYVYRELIGMQERSPKICDWQYTVVRAINTVGSADQRVTEIERLVKLYQYVRDQKIIKDETSFDECKENAREVTGELAKVWHQESDKTLNTETLQYVDRLYHLYMEAFPDAEDYGDMQFYYSELLWKRAENEKNPRLATERWESAAVQFTEVVKTGKVKPDLMKEAAYAAVLGWKNALAVDPRTNAPPVDDKEPTEAPKPEAIPEREQKMMAAFDIYIDYIKDPKDQELPMMKFLKGRIYWRYKHYDEAVPLFEDVLKNHLQHETAEFAANLLLDSLNRSQKYDEMLKWVDVLLDKKQFLSDKDDLSQRLALIKNQSERRRNEQAEKTGKYLECGLGYNAIFDRNPTAPDADEVLYNAGVCYEKAKSIGLAILMRENLIKRFPNSKSAQKALALLGGNYGAIAFYPQAASKYEEYAKRFGGEKDASASLANAVFYRRGIGQDDLAIKDTEFYVKQYRTKNADQAADALFGMTGIFEKRRDRDGTIKHLSRYLKEWGAKGGVDRQIIAHVKIGKLLWEQSCPVKGVGGACITVQRQRAVQLKGRRGRKRNELPTQCGPESKIKLNVVDRKPALVKEAQQHFKAAVSLWADGGALKRVPGKTDDDKGARSAQMVYWLAAAKFYQAEQLYESFLAIKFPTKLDFSENKPAKKKDSLKRFLDWMKQKETTLAKTRARYMDIVENIKGGGAHWAVASAARVGQLYQNFSDALFTAEIPSDVRTGQFAEDAVDAYCDELTNRANPLEEESVKAYSFCLDESTKRNWFNEWSRTCETELGQIRPQDFPSAAELHAPPTAVPIILDTHGAVSMAETGGTEK